MPYQSRSGRGRSSYLAYSSSNHKRRPNNRSQKKYIEPSRFVKAATVSEQAKYLPTNQFSDFKLDPVLMRNLTAKGYESPSPIQDQVIPAAMAGRDIIGLSGTGTGKTAAFGLPILQKLLKSRDNKALIIAPTRELAEQITLEFKELGRGVDMQSVLLIGGTNIGNQFRALKRHPRLVIGTPGRIKDHMKRGSLDLKSFNTVVLDEVDRMLDMGFVNDVTFILSTTDQQRQSMFFSATIESKVRTLIDTFSHDPVLVSLQVSSASENVHQDVVRFRTPSDKLEKLHDLLNDQQVSKVIVFDETQRSVEKLVTELLGRGFSAASIHGGKTQGQRKRALASFKNNEVTVLVATDVAARGIDVADISHVVNYTIPNDYDDYIHRIGRAGRAGRTGYALTFIAS
ncbi:MAG TPA: DEAD/DEAH box helicase [Candidatus Saccharimonadales bacterium]|nr:DEAD/DEAH box helicase [Candidatus Saccharimonadales bacterium]